MTQELLYNWLNHMAAGSEFTPEFDDQGVCTLVLKEEIPFSIMVSEKQPDHFVLQAVLASLSGNPAFDHQLMKKAMALNYFQQETLGGSVNIGPNPGVLSYVLVYPFSQCDHLGFGNLTENYLQAAVALKKQLSSPLPDETGNKWQDQALPDYALRV
ncbi:CesT family type III secretion system chaperone [Desulfospira joergensenii]|uniref:CesT family type III secretion system chaperone n=1 Tax=Desulfospira joergensenii TaxID=53329 RepID=UPI0003B68C83|nr:CesT family type III secretion system chaperone [Desulfospira joergensenii]